MISCSKCGTSNRDGAKFCQSCGQGLAQPASLSSLEGKPPIQPGVASSASTWPTAGPPPPTTSTEVMPAPLPPDGDSGLTAAPQPKPTISQAPASPTEPAETDPLASQAMAAAGIVPAEPAATASTRPLPTAQPVFAALPDGARIENQRYEVTKLVSESSKQNVYLVTDLLGRHCPGCGSADTTKDETFCSNCGVTLPTESPSYVLRETADADMLAQEKLVAEHKVWHPNLVNVYRFFQDCPYGTQRFYLVSDPDDGGSPALLPKPQPLEKVLVWGKQLAEGLAALHAQGIRHRNIKVASLRLDDDKARLTNFGLVEKVPKAAPKDWFADDVADLARALHEALLADQPLAPSVATVFDKALSQDKATRYASATAFAADLATVAESLQHADSVTMVVGRRSHVGMVRDHNEDSLLTLEVQRIQLSESRLVGVYVVADGMGGHAAGEVASGLSINAVARYVTNKVQLPWIDDATPPNYGDLLKEAFLEANRIVYERGRKARADMGTTLVAALVVGCEAFVANIGDSRCYRLRGQNLEQITTDHSLVERLVAAKQITREEARTHPQRNLIYRTVGDKPQVEVDVFKVNLHPDDSLLLCSDGLHGMVEDEQIQDVLLHGLPPQAACEELIRLANAAGGDDNVSVIVAQIIEAKGSR